MNKIAFLVAGTESGVGKTAVTRALIALLHKEGLRVQSYKLGPDYIDAAYHAKLSHRPCINLDTYLLKPLGTKKSSEDFLKEEFHAYLSDADAAVIEAAGGIFDNWHHDDKSPLDMACALQVPIILVIDAFASCQTASFLANCFLAKSQQIAGIIFNRVTSKEHYKVIQDAVKPTFQKKLFGYIPYEKLLWIPERHLGLETASEAPLAHSDGNTLAQVVKKTLDIKKLHSLTCKIPNIPKNNSPSPKTVRIAIARDQAFSFYYHHNLAFLERHGADLVYFSPLTDAALPEEIHGIYIGGGFPEVHAEALSQNESLKKQIKQSADNGMPIYGECGGLMYLSRSIQSSKSGRFMNMADVIPIDIDFKEGLTLDYVKTELTKPCLIGSTGDQFKGHVFHRSQAKDGSKAQKAASIQGINSGLSHQEGFYYKNTYASYVHTHFLSAEKIGLNIIKQAMIYKKLKHKTPSSHSIQEL